MDLNQLSTWFSAQIQTTVFQNFLVFFIPLSVVMLAMILGYLFWELWLKLVRSEFNFSLKYSVLELKLPKDTFKSPLAMELVLQAIHNTSDGSKYVQYWKGESRPYYSLEIISIGGQVKFLMWGEDRRKVGTMNALYSQFPGIEIREIDDYSRTVHYDPATMKIWGAEFAFTKKDPYPIKTYIDYGLDKDPKEEFKIDPLTPLIEFLGSVPLNQQVWVQIPIVAHRKQRKPGHLMKMTDLWEEHVHKLINDILIRDPDSKVAGEINPDTGYAKLPTISEGERELVGDLERRLTKHAFDCVIRAVYIAPKKEFNTPFGIGGIISGFKHFSTNSFNGFKPNGDKWHPQFDSVPWEDFHDIRRNRMSRNILKAYRRRALHYPPFESKHLVLNTEELATMYHFPGSVAATPTLDRVPSKKSEAPVNLPI